MSKRLKLKCRNSLLISRLNSIWHICHLQAFKGPWVHSKNVFSGHSACYFKSWWGSKLISCPLPLETVTLPNRGNLGSMETASVVPLLCGSKDGHSYRGAHALALGGVSIVLLLLRESSILVATLEYNYLMCLCLLFRAPTLMETLSKFPCMWVTRLRLPKAH